MKTSQKQWHSDVPRLDNFGKPITDTFIDGATRAGPWALMTPDSHRHFGMGLGTGRGQRYVKQSDGRWIKNAG